VNPLELDRQIGTGECIEDAAGFVEAAFEARYQGIEALSQLEMFRAVERSVDATGEIALDGLVDDTAHLALQQPGFRGDGGEIGALRLRFLLQRIAHARIFAEYGQSIDHGANFLGAAALRHDDLVIAAREQLHRRRDPHDRAGDPLRDEHQDDDACHRQCGTGRQFVADLGLQRVPCCRHRVGCRLVHERVDVENFCQDGRAGACQLLGGRNCLGRVEPEHDPNIAAPRRMQIAEFLGVRRYGRRQRVACKLGKRSLESAIRRVEPFMDLVDRHKRGHRQQICDNARHGLELRAGPCGQCLGGYRVLNDLLDMSLAVDRLRSDESGGTQAGENGENERKKNLETD